MAGVQYAQTHLDENTEAGWEYVLLEPAQLGWGQGVWRSLDDEGDALPERAPLDTSWIC
jgi:hypothetical protein